MDMGSIRTHSVGDTAVDSRKSCSLSAKKYPPYRHPPQVHTLRQRRCGDAQRVL